MNTDWMAGGKCKEVAPDVFFPNDGMGVLVAQRICAECPVSEACLEYALEEHGASVARRRRTPAGSGPTWRRRRVRGDGGA